MIREKIGLLAAIVFVFCILSFAGRGTPESSMQVSPHSSVDQPFDHSGILETITESNWMFSIRLAVGYGRLKNDSLRVLNGSSYLTGVAMGHSWQPQNTSFEPQATGIKYTVSGAIEWQLVGWVVYRQNKYYTGFIAAPNENPYGSHY